jgi:hypothetical protein
MAWEKVGPTLPGMVAGADLTAAQHRFVVVDSSGTVVLAGAGVAVDGVLQNNPNTDHAATVWGIGSVSKVEAGAAVAQGAFVTPNATGQAVTAATTNYIAGRALGAATGSGQFISVWQTSPGRVP